MAAELTPAENALLLKTAELWNGFLALPVQHADDLGEFRHTLHTLQRIILARPVMRAGQVDLR